MWRDTIDLLRLFGKDTNSPKYVCPSDLKAEHDRLMHKRNKEIERKKLEERIRQAKKHEKAYRKLKGIFFDTYRIVIVVKRDGLADSLFELFFRFRFILCHSIPHFIGFPLQVTR